MKLLQDAVILLALVSLSTALIVYLLMEAQYRRYLSRQARHLMLASQLAPAPDGGTVRALWSRSGRVDREIIEDILVNQCRSSGGRESGTAEQALRASGIPEHWVRELRAGGLSRRVRAARRLGYFRDPRAVEALTNAGDDPSPEVRLAITLSLGRLRDPQGLAGLIRVARKPGSLIPDLTLAAALAACAEGCPSRLAELLRAPEARLRLVGAWALSEVADQTVLPQLLAAARDPESEVRAKAAKALGRIPCGESREGLDRLARDPVWFVRVRALDALGKLQDSSDEGAAFRGLDDKVREVRYRAAYALRQIRGMKGEVVAKILHAGSRRSFNSLISEWDRAGFLGGLVAGLSTHEWPRFIESRETLQALIAAGVTRALTDCVLIFPDIKVKLRLLRLLREAPAPDVRADLRALADHPGCDRRVAAKIREAVSDALIPPAGAHRPNA